MNRVLSLLLVLLFFFNLFGNLLTPLLSNYVLTIGGKVADAGVAYAIMTWVSAGTLIIAPKIKKYFKISDKTFLYISYMSPILGAIWYLYITDLDQFYILQALSVVFGAMSIPIIFKWYQTFLTKDFATRGWGLHKAMIALSSGFASIISSHLVAHENYTHVFYFSLSVSLFTYLVLIVTMRVYYKDLPRKDQILGMEA